MDAWTTKHEPRRVADMVGPKTPGETLLNWLNTWKQSKFRCALITGPTGCGKSMLARIACKEAGLIDVVVLDSCRKRTKKTMMALQESFKSVAVKSFFTRTVGQQPKPKSATTAVLIEDIDYCDQGGLPQIMTFIRKSLVPVICIAGDGYNKSLKPLADIALAVRMFRPSSEQIASRLVCIAIAEKKGDLMNTAKARTLAIACGCDMRQSIIELQMLLHTSKVEVTKNEDGRLCDHEPGLFEIVPKLFSPPNTRTFRYAAECERLCLADRSMVPLMVHENYPRAAGGVSLDALAGAADAISIADTMLIRATSEMHAFFASTLPCSRIVGPMATRPGFPAILGEISRTTRMHESYKAISVGLGMNMSELITERLWVMRIKYCRVFSRVPAAKIGEAARLIVAELVSSGITRGDWDVLIGKGADHMPYAAKTAVAKAFDEAVKKAKKTVSVSRKHARTETENSEEDEDADEEDRPAPKQAKNTK